MAADKAELHGVALPQPGPAAAAVLAAQVPEYGSARNPVDVTAQVITDASVLAACADALLTDPAYGVLVTTHGYAYASTTARLATFANSAAQAGKPICNVWIPEWLGGPGAAETEAQPNLSLFHSMDRCFATLAAWHRRHAMRMAPPPDRTRLSKPAAADAARALLAAIPGTTLTERQAKQVMALYGIPFVPDTPAQTPQEAVAAAEAIGFPVVLKGESPDILHKTEAGLVKLALPDAAAVHAAAHAILDAVATLQPPPRYTGMVVQPMLPKGVEIVVGARYDPQFGPLVVVGLGGVLVEVLRDTALALAPVSPSEVLDLLASLKGTALLDGFRGAPAVDRAHLAAIVARFSELAADAGASIAEMEINPLIAAGTGIIAADALIVKA